MTDLHKAASSNLKKIRENQPLIHNITNFVVMNFTANVLLSLGASPVMAHAPNGFFMNWSGKQGGEGFEYHILVLAICLPLILTGGGKFSLDGFISHKFLQDS